MHGRDVAVLLSTFNGSRFLPEFLVSLANQDPPISQLYLRDDGSSDESVRLVRDLWSPRRISVDTCRARMGPGRSFLRLLSLMNSDVDVLLFADQDDVWAPTKVAAAVSALRNRHEPTLYFSNLIVTDDRLTPLHVHHARRPKPSFANALVQNIATGNTIALNRPAVQLLQRYLPSHAVMHDAWCYLVISGCGDVVYDPEPRVFYRQHSNNTLGVQTSRLRSWQRRVVRQLRFGGRQELFAQACELLDAYGADLRPENLSLAQRFVSSYPYLGQRFGFAFGQGIVRQNNIDTLIAKTLYILKRL